MGDENPRFVGDENPRSVGDENPRSVGMVSSYYTDYWGFCISPGGYLSKTGWHTKVTGKIGISDNKIGDGVNVKDLDPEPC